MFSGFALSVKAYRLCQLPQRGSQDLKPVAKALGVMRKFPPLLLPLPLRKDFPRSGGRCRAATKGGVWHRAAMTERAHAVALSAKASNAIRNLPAMPEPPSPRELANPQGLTEGVISFTFVLAFPVYRISAKGARVENPHETKGSCTSFTIVLYFVPARRTFVCFVPSGGVQGPYLCAKMLLFSAGENRYTTATESNRRTAKTAVLRDRCITGKGEVHYGTSI